MNIDLDKEYWLWYLGEVAIWALAIGPALVAATCAYIQLAR